ncbi:MAG: AAA family ATPase, partial [Candidatus Omnitrophota bacterium]
MIEARQIKRLPYGNADFDSFPIKNLYFVDKTSYIRNIEMKGRYLSFTRPRCFGSTLFLSILGDYYDIAKKDEFDTLFNGTDIQKNPTPEKNKYLIFRVNFSLVNPDISIAEQAFLTRIKNAAHFFISKYERFLDIDINQAKIELNARKSASDVMVEFLSFFKSKKEKLYVIIDEYDNFANTILSKEGEAEFQKITHGGGFLRAFFNVVKGGTTEGSAPISRLFMTGVSPITLDDVTSGFNIAKNISLDPDLNEMLGFTRNEVASMINYYREAGKIHHPTDELLDIMGWWYNHYRFSTDSNTEVFNTVQCLYFLDQYLPKGRIPTEMIDRNVRFDYDKLRHLIIIDKKNVRQTNGNFSKLQHIIETGSIHSAIETGFPIA